MPPWSHSEDTHGSPAEYLSHIAREGQHHFDASVQFIAHVGMDSKHTKLCQKDH